MKRALVVLALCAGAPPVFAQGAPATVSFAARLQDSGLPLMGTHNFTFAIFDTPTGGTPLWQEQRNNVQVGDDGLLYLDLGSVTALNGTTVFGGSARYLEITIDTNPPASPRITLESVPYALRSGKAGDADGMGGLPAAGWQKAVASTCTGTQSIQTVAPDGSVSCVTPPMYSAGTGLQLANGIFSIDPGYLVAGSGISITGGNTIAADTTIQRALTTPCLAGQLLNTFSQAGGTTCYGLAANGGLLFSGGNFSVDTTAIQPKIAPVSVDTTGTSLQTTSNSYTTLSPSVTATIPASGTALVTVTAGINPGTNNAMACMSFSGGGVSAADTRAVCSDIGGNTIRASATYLVNGLTTGSVNFTAQYRTTGGHSVTFTNPSIVVVPMP